MLYECNYPRLLIAKYGPLFFGLGILFGFVPQIMSDNPDIVITDLISPIILALSLLILFLFRKDKFKYVAIGKTQIIIKKDRKEIEYSWLDAESITLNRFLGLYKLKIKNEDEIYFTPYGMTTWLTGDNSHMGVIINKMKRELSI